MMVDYSTDGIFGDLDYGAPYVSKGLSFAMSACTGGFSGLKLNPCKMLVVGPGNGFELVYYGKMGFDVTGIDLYQAEVQYVKDRVIQCDATNMPFEEREFEFVHCTEMLEHVEYEDSLKILKEIKRVGHVFMISIASAEDVFKTHINIRSPSHWMDVMENMGFSFYNAQYKPNFIIRNGRYVNKINYAEGFFGYGLCDPDRKEKGEGRPVEQGDSTLRIRRRKDTP
jgi:hypothetical protein